MKAIVLAHRSSRPAMPTSWCRGMENIATSPMPAIPLGISVEHAHRSIIDSMVTTALKYSTAINGIHRRKLAAPHGITVGPG
jgi:hypothetical protein